MLKLIIVDDSSEDLLLIHRIMEQCKLLNPLSCVASVSACIAELEKMQSEPNPQPSLIFLDLMMGNQSGLDALRYIQSAPCRETSLVVMLSGLRQMKIVNEGYQLGAKTFLLKPLAVRDVAELVNSLPEIGIEELQEGYILHWKPRLKDDTESRFKTTRIKTLAA